MASQVQATEFSTTFPTLRTRRLPLASHAARVGVWVRQSLCGLNGHDKYLHVDGARVALRCVSCKHESPGWETGDRAYQLTYAGDPSRHRMK